MYIVISDQHANTALRQIQRQSLHRGIEGRLTGSVGVVVGRMDVADTAHVTADRNDQRPPATREMTDQRLAQPYRTQRVDIKGFEPVGIVDLAEPILTPTLPIDAGIVQQDLQRGITELCRQPDNLLRIGNFLSNGIPPYTARG